VRPSLNKRLFHLYSASTLVVLVLAAGAAWIMMRRALVRALDESLYAEAQAFAGRVEIDMGSLEFESGTLPPARRLPTDPYVAILDDHGRIIFASASSGDGNPLGSLRARDISPESHVCFNASPSADEGAFRFVGFRTLIQAEDDPDDPDDGGSPMHARVFVARPLAPVTATMTQLATVLGFAAAASLCVGLVLGRWATRRAARPVHELADSVARVNPALPDWPIDESRVPVELEPIVRTTRSLLDRVRDELENRRRLTTDVAHDLRTPVAGVRALLDVCLQRPRSASEYVEAIQQSRAALRELSRLLDDVLTLSRLEAGVDQPTLTVSRLREILSAAAATVQPLASARGIRLSTAPAPELELRTDGPRLIKILSNLLSNAVEHSPAGEEVRLATTRNGTGLEISVTDRGAGIPAEMRDRIFDRFVRADAARSGAGGSGASGPATAEKGSEGHHGLGLPIAARLARMLGGEVSLDTQYSPGSRFVFKLPRT